MANVTENRIEGEGPESVIPPIAGPDDAGAGGAGAGGAAAERTERAEREAELAEGKRFAVHDRRFWVQNAGEASGDDPGGDEHGESSETRPSKPSYVALLEERLERKDARLKEYIEAHKSAERRFDESRARLRRKMSEEVERAKGQLVVRFFDVLDNLDRSLEAVEQTGDCDTLADGVRIVRKQFFAALEDLGLSRLEPEEGELFDPNHHEAVSVIPVADPSEDQTVRHVLRSGYRQGDNVLRAAMVVVGRHQT